MSQMKRLLEVVNHLHLRADSINELATKSNDLSWNL